MAAIGQGHDARVRVSDPERERTVELLREAWLAGRLEDDELEERIRESWEARYVDDLWRALRELPVPSPPTPPPERFPAEAGWSVALSSLAATAFAFTLSLAFLFTLPVAAAGWFLGRQVRIRGGARGQGPARFGEVLGAVVAICSLVALAGCAAIVVTVG